MRFDRFEVTIFPDVYPPSEDSYLLLDAIRFTTADSVLDVGCGAGLVSLMAHDRARLVVSIDRSLEAVRNTRTNLDKNGFASSAMVFQADLLTALRPDALFSVIAFNPPYLPEEDNHSDMDHALIGGPEGTETTLRFLEQAVPHLRYDGRIYVVASSLSNMDKVRKRMEDLGLNVDLVAEQKMFFETLVVLQGTCRHKETVL
ncbi:MAG: HemK2/MTQ2 family protein methyltransferase [Candidatus Thorarchaeota archaeon]|nr:MAG: hypothetical protein DRP09_08440 [Candidatus Thorarchaeota archaeon]RLI59645.1 MAG: hypothetical protein DRO87_02330 [Candidatus Thorarchaeota archaeon]